MIGGNRVIAVIPARGGSKTIPKKNLRPLGGKPLILWSIEVARKVEEVDRVLVSTDDPVIAEVAEENGAEAYRRPEHLATDEALVIHALQDLVGRLRAEGETAEIMVLLEPTSPLRSAADVRRCLERMIQDGLDSIATFETAELNPHRAWRINGSVPEPFIPGADPWLPRQKLPEAHQLNGAVYAFRMEEVLSLESSSLLFGRAAAVSMPKERSIDIDDERDFALAEWMLSRNHEQEPV